MATFRDDLARAGRWLVETVQDRTGRQIVPAEQVELTESLQSENRVMRRTLDWIGFRLFNIAGGQPFELRQDQRQFAARQALTAWERDALAGEQVELYVSFVFGRGVPKPRAHDGEVQDHLDRTWSDGWNREILTDYERLVEKAVDLCIDANVSFRVHDDGEDGMARLSLVQQVDMLDAVRHPRRWERILYYRVRERVSSYDYRKGSNVQPASAQVDPPPVYIEAYGAFNPDDPVERVLNEGITEPPPDLRRSGRIVHLAVNKTSAMAFGIPRMRRLLPWFKAYRETLESHVARMKAMASIYMKVTERGGQKDLDRIARMAMQRPSAFDTDQSVGGGVGSGPGPAMPGIWQQNESLNAEPFKIDSGATDVQASAPILRGQAGGPWPDHYLSGSADGTIAGTQSMELPVLRFVGREQKLWEKPFRALADSSIDAAVRTGIISEYRDPTAEEQQAILVAEGAGQEPPFELDAAGRVKRDLGYDFSLPSPLERAMGDLVSAAVQLAAAVDPNGQVPEMSRWLFGFVLAEAFDVEDPQRIVDQVLPKHVAHAIAGVDPQTGLPRDAAAAVDPNAVGPDGDRHPPENPYGAPVKSPQPEQRPVTETVPRRIAALQHGRGRVRQLEHALGDDVVGEWRAHLDELRGVPALNTNGNGSGGPP